MHIIDMPLEVVIVAGEVFPITPLPEPDLSALAA
jgi:hypothetical protein